MPVILEHDQYETWLTGTPDAAYELIRPCPEGILEERLVNVALNNSRAEGDRLLDPTAKRPPEVSCDDRTVQLEEVAMANAQVMLEPFDAVSFAAQHAISKLGVNVPDSFWRDPFILGFMQSLIAANRHPQQAAGA